MSLLDLLTHFFRLYGRRNRIFLPGLRERIDFLNIAIGDLQEAIRKEFPSSILRVALARIASRIIGVAEHFRDLPFTEVLCQKYPVTHCSYCRQAPCACPERRPAASLPETVEPLQLSWTLGQWQQHLGTLYGDRNRQRGLENVLNRLSREISELLSLQMKIPYLTLSLEDIEREFALELADALAWTVAVANILSLDLEDAVLERFGSGCWNCRKIPCVCTHFNVSPVDWATIQV